MAVPKLQMHVELRNDIFGNSYHHLENQNDGRNPGIVFVFPFWHISASIADSNTILTATSILEVQQLNGSIVHYIRHKGRTEIQNDGLQTESTSISACGRDKNAMMLTQ